MISKPDKNKIRQRRHMRVRGKISGYAQLIDDVKGVTLASASTQDTEVSGKTKTEQAAGVGALIAKRGVEKNVTTVVFDRGGYLYHGRVQALAEAARENGLQF